MSHTSDDSVAYRHNEAILVDMYDRLFGGSAETDLLLEMAGEPSGRVVEAGCGTGRVLLAFRTRGWETIGFDCDGRVLGIAKNKICSDSKVNLLQADMRDRWPVQSAGLAIIAFNTLLLCGSVDEVRSTLSNARNALQPGGRLLCSIFSLRNRPRGVVYQRAPRVHDGHIFSRSGWILSGTNPQQVRVCYEVKVCDHDGQGRTFIGEWAAVDLAAREICAEAEKVGLKPSRIVDGTAKSEVDRDREPDWYVLELTHVG